MTGTLLVTGGFGYLGGRLLTDARGANVALRTTTRRPSDQWPAWAKGLEVYRAGLDDPVALARLCEGVETVIHLAAMNAGACAADPEGAHAVNVEGTRRLVAAAEAAGVRRLVYFSTAHVYAAPLVGRVDESSPTTNPHPYAATHRKAEDIVRGAGLRGLVFRLSNAFGAPADTGADCWMLLVNDLCRQAVQDRRLVLRGSGLERRDFIPLDDVVGAVFHFLGLSDSTWGDGLFNLGRGKSYSTLAVAQQVADRCVEVLGFCPPIERQAPESKETPADLDFRIDRLHNAGFMPAASPAAEIDATLRLCREAFGG